MLPGTRVVCNIEVGLGSVGCRGSKGAPIELSDSFVDERLRREKGKAIMIDAGESSGNKASDVEIMDVDPAKALEGPQAQEENNGSMNFVDCTVLRQLGYP